MCDRDEIYSPYFNFIILLFYLFFKFCVCVFVVVIVDSTPSVTVS